MTETYITIFLNNGILASVFNQNLMQLLLPSQVPVASPFLAFFSCLTSDLFYVVILYYNTYVVNAFLGKMEHSHQLQSIV